MSKARGDLGSRGVKHATIIPIGGRRSLCKMGGRESCRYVKPSVQVDIISIV
jgi:hypothetical protein